MVASAALTSVKPVAIAAALDWFVPAAATVALGMIKPAEAVTVVPDTAPVLATDAPVMAPVALKVVNAPVERVVAPMGVASTEPLVIAWSL